MQQDILAKVPSQIEGLRMRLEEAEASNREKGRRLRQAFADGTPVWMRWLHEPNQWVLIIVGTTVATIIAGLVVALIVSSR